MDIYNTTTWCMLRKQLLNPYHVKCVHAANDFNHVLEACWLACANDFQHFRNRNKKRHTYHSKTCNTQIHFWTLVLWQIFRSKFAAILTRILYFGVSTAYYSISLSLFSGFHVPYFKNGNPWGSRAHCGKFTLVDLNLKGISFTGVDL